MEHLDHDHNSHGHFDEGAQNSFCMKSPSMAGMTMYMSGFRSTLFDSDLPCINLLSAKLNLDSEWKFLVAMVVVAYLGIIIEGLPTLRLKYLARLQRDGCDINGKKVSLILSAFHGFQALLGYILMLAAMTYSIELLISAVVGLSIGHYISSKQKRILRRNQSPSYDTTLGLDNATPCCEFLQDDADEDPASSSFGYLQLTPGSNSEEIEERTSLHQRPNANGVP